MPKIFHLDQIREALEDMDLMPAIEEGFVAYSQGKVVVPPVGELLFKDPPGDVHIKYGYIMEDDVYVIKIASGFYENLRFNLPSSNGLMLVFSQKTGELAYACNLIVSATPARHPLLKAQMIQKGTHITAMGSDTPEKNEIDPEILRHADIVVADSISQCLSRGEIHKALEAGSIEKEKIIELGHVIENEKLRRSSEEQITVADLTGVAVQDIQISKAVYRALRFSMGTFI